MSTSLEAVSILTSDSGRRGVLVRSTISDMSEKGSVARNWINLLYRSSGTITSLELSIDQILSQAKIKLDRLLTPGT